ncbi:hypothetical protein D3C81_1774580 [compost metagenome]
MLKLQDFVKERDFIFQTAGTCAFLICPVRRDPVFGRPVHLPGADLNLRGFPVRANDRRMQRLVHVRLRHGDVILKPPRHRLPQRMDDPQGRVTVLDIVNDDANGQQIVNFVELLVFHRHLLIHAVNMLWTPRQIRLHAHFL